MADIGPIPAQTRGEPLDHPADHRVVGGAARDGRGRCGGGLRVLDACERGAHKRRPLRAFGGVGEQRAPDALGLLAAAVLFRREALIEARGGVAPIAVDRVVERFLGLGGDDAVGGGGERLAVIGFALGGRAEQAQRVAARLRCVVVAAEVHVDGRDHFPATAVVRVLLEMRFDAGKQRLHRVVIVGGGDARGERLVGQAGRSDREIERDRADRQRHERGRRRQTTPRPLIRGTTRPGALHPVGGGEQPARDFDARRFGLRRRDEPGDPVAIDFGELVAVDGDVVRVGRGVRVPAARQRPRDGGHRRNRHQRQHDPQAHELAVPI